LLNIESVKSNHGIYLSSPASKCIFVFIK
jgi:hypothetical protein